MKKRPLTIWMMVIGWGLLVVAGVQGGQKGLELRKRQLEALTQAEETFSRLQGWVQVEKKVEARRNQLLGPLVQGPKADLSWVVLKGLQEVVKQEEMMVSELRPTWIPKQKDQPASLRLDAKIEGNLSQVSHLLRRLPEAMPGLRLESVQLMSQGEERIQTLLRIRLQELAD